MKAVNCIYYAKKNKEEREVEWKKLRRHHAMGHFPRDICWKLESALYLRIDTQFPSSLACIEGSLCEIALDFV